MSNLINKIPVTILSGFLGSGKTTLVKRILQNSPNSRIAILENELGNVPVDDALLSQDNPARLDTVLGRSCCDTRAQFVEKLRKITFDGSNYDRLIIESTGVAHPGMLAHAFLMDPVLKVYFKIDGIVTVVDALNFSKHAHGDGHAVEQVAYADLILINKSDLVEPQEIESLTVQLRGINDQADYFVTRDGDGPLDKLLNIGGFDLDRIANGVKGCRKSDASNPAKHEHEIETLAIESEEVYDFTLLRNWMEEFLVTHPLDIYRAKGVVAIEGIDQRMIFQGVHGRIEGGFGAPWNREKPFTRMIFIGKGLNRDEIRQGLAKCVSKIEPGND